MKKVKIGVIGCGVIGKMHAKAAAESPLMELVAVADTRQELAAEIGKEYGAGSVYGNAGDLLKHPEVEAVVLAIPTLGRTKIALEAFEKGKHVLVEKPAGFNASEVEAMIRARGKLIAGCCMSRFRYYESYKAISGFMEGGGLGRLREVHCRVFKAAGEAPKQTPPAWRQSKELNGGGILTNWGCYDLDFLLGITGWTLKPRLVLAQTWKVPPLLSGHVSENSDAESHYSAFIRCEDDTVITLERGEYSPIRNEESWQLIGEKGALRLDMLYKEGKEVYFDAVDPERGVVSSILWKGDDPLEPVFSGPIANFAESILENRQPRTSLENALLIQKITDAVYRSAEENCAVEIKA